jgi:dihydroxyacid dehydratase/phosphogluconate dehydratase
MVRISDSRMSGTSYGSCVLHVAPESYVGGPLAFVETGDLITLDVKARSLDLEVPEETLKKRKTKWKSPPPRYVRGYGVLFANHASQADKGRDFNFLEGTAPTAEPEIH